MLKLIKITFQIGLLAIMYIIGSAIQQYFNLFVPGSIIGLILMFTLLAMGLFKVKWIEVGAEFMMKHLVIFFIPAVVGAINYYELFIGRGSLLIVTTVISTILVMGIAGWTSQRLSGKSGENL